MQGDVRSRRAGMVDPKPSILLCCRVLRAAAASSLSPELLRRAKFDSPDSVRTPTAPVFLRCVVGGSDARCAA